MKLCSKLFQLKGGPTCLNLSVDDLHSESVRNPTEYTPDRVAKLYILISRWDAPVTPQGREHRSAQKEDRERERMVASQTLGPVPTTSSPDVHRIPHPSSSRLISTHNPLNSSLIRRSLPRYPAHSVCCGPNNLDDDSIMDETETNSTYNVDSYLSGNANNVDGLSERLHTSRPRQADSQKRPRY